VIGRGPRFRCPTSHGVPVISRDQSEECARPGGTTRILTVFGSVVSDASKRMDAVRDYFRMVDSGDPDVMLLFTEDVELYFPKFGFGSGKADMAEFARRLGQDLGSIEHDVDGLEFVVAGERVVVEGREWGTNSNGEAWPDGRVSTGRFCNVFRFRDQLISSVHIYTDPDFNSSHKAKVDQLHRS
jgi:ketosteroid isomerase-like protein